MSKQHERHLDLALGVFGKPWSSGSSTVNPSSTVDGFGNKPSSCRSVQAFWCVPGCLPSFLSSPSFAKQELQEVNLLWLAMTQHMQILAVPTTYPCAPHLLFMMAQGVSRPNTILNSNAAGLVRSTCCLTYIWPIELACSCKCA